MRKNTQNIIKSVHKKSPSINVNDVFEELVDRNRELEQQIKHFIEFKLFFEQICNKLKSYLTEEELEKLNKFNIKSNHIFGQKFEELSEKCVEKVDINEKNTIKPKNTANPKIVFRRVKHLSKDNSKDIKTKSNENIVEKRFVCDYIGCGLSFTTLFSLRRHQLIHENTNPVDPYVCDWNGCNYSSPKKDNFIKHQNRHINIISMYMSRRSLLNLIIIL